MMKNQLAGLMKQAQQMQDNLKKAQEELARTEVEGQSGAGLVKVLMTCRHDVKRVSIDPSLLGDDKDMLEDLVAAAFNDGIRRAEATSQEKMGKLTAGMPQIPGPPMMPPGGPFGPMPPQGAQSPPLFGPGAPGVPPPGTGFNPGLPPKGFPTNNPGPGGIPDSFRNVPPPLPGPPPASSPPPAGPSLLPTGPNTRLPEPEGTRPASATGSR